MSLFKMSGGDLDRGPNNTGFSRVFKQEEARVRLQTVLRLVKSEVKRDIRVGLDHEFLWDPRVTNSQRANHIASVMLGVPGINDVQLRFDLVPETGVFRVAADVTYDEADQEGRRSKREQFLISAGQDTGGAT